MIDIQQIYNTAIKLSNQCKFLNAMCIMYPGTIEKILSNTEYSFYCVNDHYNISGIAPVNFGDGNQILFANHSASLRSRNTNTYSTVYESETLYSITQCNDKLDNIKIIHIHSNTPSTNIPALKISDIHDDGLMFQLSTIYQDNIMEFLIYNAVLNDHEVPRLRICPAGVETVWQIIKNSV